jgi:hypothetical protein
VLQLLGGTHGGPAALHEDHTNVRSQDLIEQRPLRLGDIVDDYCPRERRITNHAIVVMTGADIHLTRCTACEAEHPYKHAKLPTLRKKDSPDSADSKPGHLVKSAPAVAEIPASAPEPAAETAPVENAPVENAPAVSEEGGWTHRPLIRAALPKGVVPAAPRPLPDFTMRNLRNRDGRSNGRRFSR